MALIEAVVARCAARAVGLEPGRFRLWPLEASIGGRGATSAPAAVDASGAGA
ncbi:hypothetical protein [Streptomyces sp. NPDC058755]|uniref:hypothetical protein n=1 Tax=Streptomyces sp. NPDC058755 TaxID=3346624 RepID=UPI0036CCFCAF